MEVAGLESELGRLRRLLEREEGVDETLSERRRLLEEAVALGRSRPTRTAVHDRKVKVRLRESCGIAELGVLLSTDREMVLGLEDRLEPGDEKLLLIDTSRGVVLPVRGRVVRSEPGLCRFDVRDLSRSDRLALLEAVAVDLARSGLGSLGGGASPEIPQKEPHDLLSGAYLAGGEEPDLDEDGKGPRPAKLRRIP